MSGAPVSGVSPALAGDGRVQTSDSYYGLPIINEPVWTWEIPVYFFTGGLAAGSALLAPLADRSGLGELAQAARRVGAAAALASPPLLIADLGRPERFHHMLRIVRPTSPMSVGSWVLAVFVPAQLGGALLAELDILPGLRRLAESVAAALAPVMGTYTAVLFANTSVPIWHEARTELPLIFAGGSAASAGAAALLVAPVDQTEPARRFALLGGLAELVGTQLMQRRLDELAEPYQEGEASTWSHRATGLTVAGSVLLGLGRGGRGSRRGLALAGAASMLAGAMCERWAVYRAGFASARDPKYTVKPQRERIERMNGSDSG